MGSEISLVVNIEYLKEPSPRLLAEVTGAATDSRGLHSLKLLCPINFEYARLTALRSLNFHHMLPAITGRNFTMPAQRIVAAEKLKISSQ